MGDTAHRLVVHRTGWLLAEQIDTRVSAARSWTGTLHSCARRIVCAMQRYRSVAAETQGCRRIEHDGDGGNWSACPGVAGVSTDEMTTPARA
jgi:hypothetical protein